MTHARRDLITGVIFAGAALLLFAYTSGFPVREGRPAAMGPGFYPRILAVLLGVLSLIQIVSAGIGEYRHLRSDQKSEGIRMQPIWKDRKSLYLFCLTLALLIVYPFLMNILGFGLTGLLFLGTLIYALSRDNRKGKGLILILVLTVAITLFTYLVFVAFLKIPFPAGLLAEL